MATPIIEHGTRRAYEAQGCQCDECRTANAARHAALKAKRAATLAPDDARHGKRSTYNNYGCRCPFCTNAHSMARRTEREANA